MRKCVIEEQNKHYYIGQRIECLTFTALKRLAFRLSSQGYGVSIIGLSDIEDHVNGLITEGKLSASSIDKVTGAVRLHLKNLA